MTEIPIAGRQARTLRMSHGITLQALATRVGLSRSHLSRFERGEKTLSMAALIRIAEALGTSVGRLLGEEVDASEIRLVRSGDVRMHEAGAPGARYRYAVLGDGVDRIPQRDVFLLHLDQGGQRVPDAVHAGDELLYVLEGRVEISIAERRLSLDPGDYVEFPGRIPHVIRSTSENALCLVIVLRDG